MAEVKTNVKNQYLAALSVNIITFTYGAFLVWPSASFLVLQSPDSPLETGPMSDDDAGWVSSMLYLGGMLGTIFFAWCAGKFGRRRSLMLVAVPALLGWLIIPLAKNPAHFCLSRFMGGLASGGIYGVIPVYITEVADNNVRGVLGTFLIFACNIGILLAFILGYYFSYEIVAWIMAVPCLIYLCSFSFLPETPQYLLRKKEYQKFEKSYYYFHNIRTDTSDLPHQFNTELQKLKKTEEIPQPSKTLSESSLSVQDFLSPKARKALGIGVFIATLNIFCGVSAMLNYAATIFQKANSNLSPNMSAIVVGVIQIVGSYVSTFLVERSGRKALLISSSIGTALGQISLGIYAHFDAQGYDVSAFSWIPVASFSFAILFSCVGILPLTTLLISELMPPKIRNVGCMICMLCLRMFAFALLKLLPLLIRYMGLHYMVYMFGFYALTGVVFILIFIPETKGKSIEAIMASL